MCNASLRVIKQHLTGCSKECAGKRQYPRETSSNAKTLTLLHFNVRLMREKFDEMTSEVLSYDAQIVCITETWLSTDIVVGCYQMDGYSMFSNCRPAKAGGGVAIYVSADLAT